MDNNIQEPIFNAVNAYLESDDKLAFQINGPWGIGKTYYVKNEVISRLKGYNIIYFSFYGYDDLAAVKKALNIEILKKIIPDKYQSNFSFIESTFLSKYGRLKKLINKLFKRSELIFRFIELGFPFIQDFVIQKNVKNLVFILDDLERISDKIDLRDVLGFIQSELLERLNSKVVLISNESALKKVVAYSENTGNLENNENTNECEYFKIKEKIIGKTIEFKADRLAIRKILESQNITFINENLDWVLNMLYLLKSTNDDKGINLRTLLCIIDDFSYLSQKLVKNIDLLDSNQRNKIQKSLFLNIFVITNEMKLGRLQRDDLNELQNICNSRSFITSTLFDEDKQKSKSAKIIDKYHKTGNPKFDDYIFYHQDINEYIFTGYFAQSKYVSDWNNIFLQYDDLSKLEHFENLSDEEFFKLQKNILKNKLDEISLENLLKLACLFKYFEENDLLAKKCSNYMELIFPIVEDNAKKLRYTINKFYSYSYENFSNLFPEKYEYLVQLSEKNVNSQNELDRLLNTTYFPFTESTRFFKMLVEFPETIEKYIYSEPSKAGELASKILRYKNEIIFEMESELKYAYKFKTRIKRDLEIKQMGKITKFLLSKRLLHSVEVTISEFEKKIKDR